MKLTFPHMGNVYIAAKAFFEELGQEVIPPPRNSNKTLEIGTKYSQETICLPLKVMIGNFVETIEKGADTILLTGSWDLAGMGTIQFFKEIYCMI